MVPLAFHTATTDGPRGAVATVRPARQRVVHAVVVELTWVLHAHHDQVVGDHRPAGLRAERHGEELLGLAAVRALQSDGTANRPSLEPSALPSVEIHRLPWLSKARLSGHEIGLTLVLSNPAK